MSKASKFGQSLSPSSSTMERLAENNFNVLRVKIDNVKTCFKFLISKIIFSEDVFVEFEAVALWTSYEKFVYNICSDKNAERKYKYLLFSVRHLIQSLDTLVKMNVKDRFQYMEVYRQMLKNYDKIISRRFYFRVKGSLIRFYEVSIQTRMKKKFKAKAYIGKGYGDKGSAKNVCLDGSPDWKEVAMDARNISDELSTYSKFISFFEEIRSHPRQLVPKKPPT